MRLFRAIRDEGVRLCGAMEVSSQALARHRVDGITFDTAVFTNLSPDHIGTEEHPDYAHYRDSKKRLFAQCRHGIFNADDPGGGVHDGGQSLRRRAPAAIHRPAESPGGGSEHPEGRGPVRYGVHGGRHHLPHSGCRGSTTSTTLWRWWHSVGRYTDHTRELAEALSYVTVPGRFEVLPDVMPGCTVVLDFAHNSISMNALLQTARSYDPGSHHRRVRHRRPAPESAASQLGEAVAKGADCAMLTTDDPDRDDPAEVSADIATCFGPGSCPHVGIVDRREAVRYALEQMRPGDMAAAMRQGPGGIPAGAGEEDPLRRRGDGPLLRPVSCWSPAHRPCDRDKEGFLQDKKRTVRHKPSTHKDNMNCVQSI